MYLFMFVSHSSLVDQKVDDWGQFKGFHADITDYTN